MNHHIFFSVITLLTQLAFWCVPQAHAQSTAFTYQGRLSANDNFAVGTYDLEFKLFDAYSGGNQVSSPNTLSAVAVNNGLFTVSLDFGTTPFNGASRWLEIGVRTNAGDTFTTLSPRQQITSAPYAVQALNAGNAANYTGAITDGQLSGNIARLNGSNVFAGPVQFNNPNNTFNGNYSGNGAAVTNVNLMTVNTGGAITWPVNYGAFVLNSSPSVGRGPRSVVTADVNADGGLDVICGNETDRTLSVLTNNGSGEFVLASSLSVGTEPTSVTAADVNGDGKVDLINANGGPSTLTVFTNNGSGSFVQASSLAVGSNPRSVTAADINGDGKMDLVSANGNANALSVLTNSGTGGFGIVSSPAVGAMPMGVTAADVNSDGRMDLISANMNAGTLSVLTNDGNGGFVLAFTPTVGSDPVCVTAADVSGDGKMDLISANMSGNTLSVLTNKGSSGFTLASSPAVGLNPRSVAAADVNGDGRVDLICANQSANTLSVLTNKGSGTFALASSPAVGTSPLSVAAADVSGDGKVDLVSANTSANTLSVLFNTPISQGGATFTGNGSGLTSLNASQLVGTVAINGTTIIDAAGNWVGSKAGFGLTWRGAWSSSTSYTTNDAVQYSGSAWVALKSNTNSTPVAGATWSLLAQKGDTGATGATGPTGPQGPPGPAVDTIAICASDSYYSGSWHSGDCNCSSGTLISRVYANPCTAVASSGSCSASGGHSGLNGLTDGACCVCRP